MATGSEAAIIGALGGTLAIEEMAFFFVTNILIGFGMVLMLSATSQERAKRVLGWAKATLRTGRIVTD